MWKAGGAAPFSSGATCFPRRTTAPPRSVCGDIGGRRCRDQARTFSTSALKEAFGREPLNWWKTSPSRTTAKVGMERTP